MRKGVFILFKLKIDLNNIYFLMYKYKCLLFQKITYFLYAVEAEEMCKLKQ